MDIPINEDNVYWDVFLLKGILPWYCESIRAQRYGNLQLLMLSHVHDAYFFLAIFIIEIPDFHRAPHF